jgi:hypothetical protein
MNNPIIYDNRYMIDYINQLNNGLKPMLNPNNMSSTNEPSDNNLNLQIGEGELIFFLLVLKFDCSLKSNRLHFIFVTGYGDYDQPAYGVPPSGVMSGLSKSMGLKDLFDIALTTLAFLSFGMFFLQVIMCITMTKTDNNMLMMPMEIDGDIDGGEDGSCVFCCCCM